jgi:hypothetical protein
MSKYSLPATDPVISEENAMAQVMLFLRSYDFDIDSIEKDGQKTMELNTDRLLRYVMNGQIEIEEIDGETKVKLNIKNKTKKNTVDQLVFGEVTGRHKAEMKPTSNEHERMTQLMGALCETAGGTAAIEQLRKGDRKALEVIAPYFL